MWMSAGQSRAHHLRHTHGNWPEVLLINDYAVFMGYLSIAVTGTGFLVLTWSTVVLLGGFVSMLSNKDFWSLTVITLVQTRTFDVFLNGNISHIGYSCKRLWESAVFIALPHRSFGFRGAVRVLVFTIVLCPLFLLYMFGLFVSPWISLWRLIQHDYGVTAGDSSSKAHLQPALVVLYSLALFQGVLFYYRAISAWEEHKLVKDVADKYRFDTVSRKSVSDYLHEIKVGCEKDPSFARGRNLITYAAKLMESTSGYLSGARILDTLIQFNKAASVSEFPEQSMLIHNTIGSASSGSILHKLVQMLDFKRPLDREIRLRAATIVEHFASDIRLDKILQGIQCISSLLPPKSYYQQGKTDACQVQHNISVKEEDIDKQLHVIGMKILFKLSNDENNLRVMSNTDDLASKMVALINNMQLHMKDHDQWSRDIAEPGVELIARFMSTTTARSNNILRQEISTSREAITSLESILNCHRCADVLKKEAIRILTQICIQTASAMHEGNRGWFIGFLIGMFLYKNRGPSFEELAGEELAQVSLRSESSATIILSRYGPNIVECVGNRSACYSSMHRKISADVLKNLYSNYSIGDELFQNLKEPMIDLMPKMLREALGWVSTGKEIQNVPTPAHNLPYVVPSYVQPRQTLIPYHQHPSYPTYYPTPEYYGAPRLGLESTQYDDGKLKEAFASLCVTVYQRMVRADADLTARFDDIAACISEQSEKPPMTMTELITEAEKVAAQTIQRPPAYYLPQYGGFVPDEDTTSCCIS